MRENLKNALLIMLVMWCGLLHVLLLSERTSSALKDIELTFKDDEIATLETHMEEIQQSAVASQAKIADLETDLSVCKEEIAALEHEIFSLCELSELRGSCADLTPSEETALLRIAMAEAGNQGVIGKALVMLSVLNRVECPGKYGDSIEGVVLSGAYTVTEPGGGYWTCRPDWECDVALFLVTHGWDESVLCEEHEIEQDLKIIYFTNQGYSYGEPMFQYRNHWFSGFSF